MRVYTFIIAATSALALAGYSEAAVFTNTFYGVVLDGSDSINRFGLGPNADLRGVTFSAVVTVDDATGNSTETNTATMSHIRSTTTALPSPINVVLTINGQTLDFTDLTAGMATQRGEARFIDEGAHEGFGFDRSGFTSGGLLQHIRAFSIVGSGANGDFLNGPNWRQPLSLSYGDVQYKGGNLTIITYEHSSKTYLEQTVLQLRWFSVNQLPTTVPEPATWALMILGLGSVGVALRSRPKPSLA